MLISLDIGNSSIKFGFFTKRDLFVRDIPTHPFLSLSRYSALIRHFLREKNIDKIPEGIIISSVVPGQTEALRKSLKRMFAVEPLIIDHTTKTGIALNIPKPEELGADRIANAVAAVELFKCPVAVIDCGTATTISVVGKNADYIGGAILPGIRLMNESLAQGTSRLSEVQISPPLAALGVDTSACIRSGLFYGTAGAVERILSEIEGETGLRLKIVMTGGNSRHISKFMHRKHKVVPHLSLEGLRIIFTRNADA
jgi:type III pantothenate kinase